MIRRFFWRCAYPFARLAHAFWGVVQVGECWRGRVAAIEAIPDEVNLCGVAYKDHQTTHGARAHRTGRERGDVRGNGVLHGGAPLHGLVVSPGV